MKTVAEPSSAESRNGASATIGFASLALVFVTISALAAIAYFTERELISSRDWVIHTYQVRSQLRDLQLQVLETQAAEAGYLFLQNPAQVERSKQADETATQTVEQLRQLTADNPHQQERLQELTTKLSEVASLLSVKPAPGSMRVEISTEERNRQNEVLSREKQIDQIIDNMHREELSLLAERLQTWDYLFKRNVVMLGTAFAVVMLMLAYNFRLLLRAVERTKEKEKRVQENVASYRSMSARILELQDAERRRIARELHDSVGQYLAGLKINLDQLDGGASTEPRQIIRESLALTDTAIREVRTISHLLHPPLLDELGFLSAARWYLDEYGKRGQIRVSLAADEPMERMSREVEIALFRVLQESLTNVYRHAGAKSVDVRLLCRDGLVRLTIADDGRGIPEEVLARFRGGAAPGIGLAGMRERLAEFGGSIHVEASGSGSVVQAVIPASANGPAEIN